MSEVVTKTPLQYLDRATSAMHSLGLMPDESGEEPIATSDTIQQDESEPVEEKVEREESKEEETRAAIVDLMEDIDNL